MYKGVVATVGIVAVHYPRTGEQADVLALVRAAAEVMRATPGCVSADCWINPADGSVVTTGRWDSEAALQASFAAVAAAGIAFEDTSHEQRPRSVMRLVGA